MRSSPGPIHSEPGTVRNSILLRLNELDMNMSHPEFLRNPLCRFCRIPKGLAALWRGCRGAPCFFPFLAAYGGEQKEKKDIFSGAPTHCPPDSVPRTPAEGSALCTPIRRNG